MVIFGWFYGGLRCFAVFQWTGCKLCSNWVWHGSTDISYPQCSLTFVLCSRIRRERYLHRCREQSSAIRIYTMSAIGLDVVSCHKFFTYIVGSHNEILQNHVWYHKIAVCIARYKRMNDIWFNGLLTVFQSRYSMKPTTCILAWNPPVEILVQWLIR